MNRWPDNGGSRQLDRSVQRLFDLSALALELQRGASSQLEESFIDWAFEALKKYVHFDSGFWGVGNATADGVPVVHTHWLHRQPPQLMVDYIDVAPHDVVFADSLRSLGVTVIADTRDGRLDAWREYVGRYHIEHVLNTCDIEPLTGLLNDIALWRAGRDRPYTEDERLFMQAAFPHLIDACTRNRLTHLGRIAMPRIGGPWAAAMADRAGVLHYAESEFPRLLTDEWPDWSGPYLPKLLGEAIAGGRAQRILGQKLVFKIAPMRDLYLLQARRATPIDRLTAREREIALHTAQGLSHKDIARLLNLSPATVRNHLAMACRRVQARNKAQIAALVQIYE